jgi:hypothetical protein
MDNTGSTSQPPTHNPPHPGTTEKQANLLRHLELGNDPGFLIYGQVRKCIGRQRKRLAKIEQDRFDMMEFPILSLD